MAFGYYKAITIQTGQVPTSQSSFPVLLPFLAGDADLATIAHSGKVQSSSGYDIRPYSDAGLSSALTYELVPGTYDATAGSFEMWVNVTAQDGLVIYLAFGNGSLVSDGSSTATWDSTFKGVWHLPNGSSLTANDSTTVNNGTITGATAGSGQIDGGATFASGNRIDVGQDTSLGLTGDLTISAWVKSTDLSGTNGVFSKTNSNLPNPYDSFIGADGHFNLYRGDGTFSNVVNGTSSWTVTVSTWAFVVVTFHLSDRATVFYLNASTTSSTTMGAATVTNGAVDTYIGTRSDFATQFIGTLDEVRLSNAVRSADWITTEYNNQSALATFWSTGILVSIGINPNVSDALTTGETMTPQLRSFISITE